MMRADYCAVDLVTVRCVPSGREVTVTAGTTLLDAVLQAKLPIGRSCDGVGQCGACRLVVMAGRANLSPPGASERTLLDGERAGPGERLACLALVRGPVTVTVGYWGA